MDYAESMQYRFYKDRDEWRDVEPVLQDEGAVPVVRIAYSPKYEDALNYFRAVVAKQEVSARALQLTTDLLAQNAANYSVWQYRRLLLQALSADLRDELRQMDDVVMSNAKNYQVWFHRQRVVDLLRDPTGELAFIAEMIADDSKNYHAWQYRQWLVDEFQLWDAELPYVDELLAADCRNNSAWNHRYFVLNRTAQLDRDDVIQREFKFATDYIAKAPHNEAAWNYLRGVLVNKNLAYAEQFCAELYEQDCRSAHLLGLMVEIGVEKFQALGDTQALAGSVDLCKQLAHKFDAIRCNYWTFMSQSLGQMLAA